MNIISTRQINLLGQYDYIEEWTGDIPPGYAKTTIEPDEFYAAYGFVIPTIEDDVVVSIAPNENAKKEWASNRPEQIRADIDFIAAMQGVSL